MKISHMPQIWRLDVAVFPADKSFRGVIGLVDGDPAHPKQIASKIRITARALLTVSSRENRIPTRLFYHINCIH
jgi:hypothetical protein